MQNGLKVALLIGLIAAMSIAIGITINQTSPKKEAERLLACKEEPTARRLEMRDEKGAVGVAVWDCEPYGSLDWVYEEGQVTAHGGVEVCVELYVSNDPPDKCRPFDPNEANNKSALHALEKKYAPK